jgi:hypothetical protein
MPRPVSGPVVCAAALIALPALASAALMTPLYPEVVADTGTGFDDPGSGATRRASFERALDIWSDVLGGGTDGAIVVSAVFDTTGGSVLAFASPNTYHANFGTGLADRVYGAALANQLVQGDLNGAGTHEINITFGDAISWYYPESGVIPSTRTDFIGTAMHEIGHGLNFTSYMSASTGAWFGGGTHPGIYNEFMVRLAGGVATPYTLLTQTERAEANVNGQAFWAGPNVMAHYGTYASLYSPSPVQPGSSISHWGVFLSSDLMSPSIAAGVRQHNPGLAAEAVADMGWELEPVANPGVGFVRGPSATRQTNVEEGGAPDTITVSLDAPPLNTVTVNIATSGAATLGVDYQLDTTTLTFPPGVKTQAFTVTALPDAVAEGLELATLTLSAPTNATVDLLFANHTVRIANVAAGMAEWQLY